MRVPIRARDQRASSSLAVCAACFAAPLLVSAAYLMVPAGHADPALPAQALDTTEGPGGFGELGGVSDIEVVVGADGSAYVLMASWGDRVRIINITDPARPAPVADMVGGQDGFVRGWAADVEVVSVGSGAYALIPGTIGEVAVQVVNITDPTRPAPISVIRWQGDAGLDWISDLEVAVVEGRAYVLVANPAKDAVQITEITDPGEPRWVTTVFEGRSCSGWYGGIVRVAGTAERTYPATAGWSTPAAPAEASRTYWTLVCFEALAGASDVVVAEVSGGSYALVAGRISGEVLVMDITNPGRPEPVASFPVLDGGRDAAPVDAHIEVAQVGQSTYALVAVPQENVIRMVEVSRPGFPVLVSEMSGHPGRVQGVEAVGVGNSTYMLVAGWDGGGLRVVDITDRSHTRYLHIAGEDAAPTERVRVVEVARVGNGTYALAAGWQSGGLWVANITDPASPAWISGGAPATGWPLQDP